jgi:hypothetical protein
MKRIGILILAGGLGFAVGAIVVSKRLASRHANDLAARQSQWQAEKVSLETALEEANARARAGSMPLVFTPPAVPAASVKLSPAGIIARLVALKPGQTRSMRQAVYWLEELMLAGPSAVPAIRDFLDRSQDIDFSPAGQGKGARGGAPAEFVVPPSLRFGLFDVLKQIGGAEAEKLLADVLGATGRGVEVLWLARTLQEIAPNKYRETALNAARDLLARPLTADGSPLDRNERDQLFGVLSMYGDTSYVSTAQGQLLRADGSVDQSALKYLQKTLGQQAVSLAAQLYDDPRINNPASKEPLARLALNFVGADAQANEFYQRAINDMTLSNGHRRNLIEDLNQDGFPDTKNLSARDLPLIDNRIALIEQLAPQAADAVNKAAFAEAYKDLMKMRQRAAASVPAVQ